MQFVDDASGTNVSTINAGDTVTWVWEGDMNHGVTAGVCAAGGGGGGGYGVYGGCGGGDCIPSQHLGVRHPGLRLHVLAHVHRRGNFTYFCAVHLSSMTGKVIVQPAVATGPCVPDDADALPERGPLPGHRALEEARRLVRPRQRHPADRGLRVLLVLRLGQHRGRRRRS